MTQWTRIHGILVPGYRVASGASDDYPYGTLERQRPIFKSLGLNLDGYFNGTLNIDIRPLAFAMAKPEFTFYNVAWTDIQPPEHFSFSRCEVIYGGLEHDGWVYYPHPETKPRHFQPPSLMEVIAIEIAGIKYGDALQMVVNEDEIRLDKD